jgi:hypothetical protein
LGLKNFKSSYKKESGLEKCSWEIYQLKLTITQPLSAHKTESSLRDKTLKNCPTDVNSWVQKILNPPTKKKVGEKNVAGKIFR